MANKRNMRDYVLYRGDEFCTIGTVDHMMEYLGATRNYINIIKSPSWKRKYEGTNRPIIYEILEDEK